MKRFCILIYLFASVWNVGCGHDLGGGDEPEQPSVEIEVKPEAGKNLYGQIIDTEGKPVRGVVVSDGKSSVVTNAYGIYQIKRSADARFVYYSTPWDYEINLDQDGSVALFYAKIPGNAGVHRQDFVLKKRDKIVKDFSIIGLGDPQIRHTMGHERFRTETMPALNSVIEGLAKPCVVLALGDLVHDGVSFMKPIKDELGKLGVPVFATIGNHDKMESSNSNEPRNDLAHTELWGPTNYSFSIGSLLFVCLDNVIYTSSTECYAGFTDEQVAWLEEHISSVNSQKTIVLFYHMPVRASGAQNRKKIIDMVSRFNEVHLMCGHTHYHENYENASPVYYEHIHAASCGAWWNSQINVDGTPNGFSVYEISGADFKNWYYHSTKGGRDLQFRLYRGNTVYGGSYGYYSFERGEDEIMANIWNADSKWSIEVYEDGNMTGNMMRLNVSETDKWCMGVHEGYINYKKSQVTKHLYHYKLKNRDAEVEIIATDRFGRKYTGMEFTTDVSDGIYVPNN